MVARLVRCGVPATFALAIIAAPATGTSGAGLAHGVNLAKLQPEVPKAKNVSHGSVHPVRSRHVH